MKPRSESGPPVENVAVSCYIIPTETPESDGTLSWNETTLVLVEAQAGGEKGIGYSYADVATGKLVESLLSDVVKGTGFAPKLSVVEITGVCEHCREAA